MRKCTKCKELKIESEFNKKLSRIDGLSLYCKKCTRKLTNDAYARRSEYYINKTKKRRIELQTLLQKKKSVPCADCKITYPYYVMDFDHIDEKCFNLGGASFCRGKTQVLNEIEKCEVVCSNCHRIRTYKRKWVRNSNG